MSSRGGGGGSTRPTDRKVFVTGQDGTLEDAGVEATGKAGQGPRIWGANPNVSSTTKLPKGTRLIIPGEPPATKLTGKADDDLTCIIGGRSVPLHSARILRTMDTGTDGWSGRIAWTPGADPKLDTILKPFGYPRAAIYIGNQLVVGGCLYGTQPKMEHNGMTMGLVGYSFTADAIDSCVMPPYEIYGNTIKQIANYYAAHLGIKAIFDDSVKDDADFMAPIKRATANEGERIFDHLAKLAAQRGGLLSCTNEGDMLFLRANSEGRPVGTLQESQPFVVGWEAHYDGRKRWHIYKCITAGVKGRVEKVPERWGQVKAGKALPPVVMEIDKDVPRSRFMTFRADEVTPGNITNAAKWKRNKHFADALTIPFPVSGWHAPDKTLWEVNKRVTVVSPTLGVPSGFTFLIRSVEFELEPNRRTATLHLIPPQAYDGKDLSDIWR